MEGKLKKIGNEYKLYAQDDRCIATSWHSPYQRLSKKNCEVIENGYDLDELADELTEHFNTFDTVKSDIQVGFKVGFQKAVELLGDNKFSEEDVRRAIYLSWEVSSLSSTDIIQSLQQTEWDVEIEMWFHGTRHKKGEWIPKLDADGCLILKKK